MKVFIIEQGFPSSLTHLLGWFAPAGNVVEPFENRFCPYERQCAILGFSLNLNLEIVSFFIYSLVALNIFFWEFYSSCALWFWAAAVFYSRVLCFSSRWVLLDILPEYIKTLRLSCKWQGPRNWVAVAFIIFVIIATDCTVIC